MDEPQATRGVRTPRRLAYLACIVGMVLSVGGPLQMRDADHRHDAAARDGQEVQAQVIGVDAVGPRLPMRPASSSHVVAFEHRGQSHTATLAGVPQPGTATVPVVVGADGSVSSELSLLAERTQAVPATFLFTVCLLALLHMFLVDAVRWRAARGVPDRVLRLVADEDVERAA